MKINARSEEDLATGYLAGPGQRGRDQVLEGLGQAHGHHGELLQGVFEQGARLHRGLVTLPCPMFATRVRVDLTSREPELSVQPSWKTKALKAARVTLRECGAPLLGGRVTLESNVEVGRGFGSSTTDVTATIRAVLDALEREMSSERVARIAVEAEVAADPLMFDRMILFAHREGAVLEDFQARMCPVRVLGVSLGDGAVDTLELSPARYDPREIESFRLLRGTLRRAVLTGDLRAIGRVATASAKLNQRFLATPGFAALLSAASGSQAVGVQVAHSGTIAGLLFDPAEREVETRLGEAERHLLDHGFQEFWRYDFGR
ncbi:GHMP kinase [Streptosporangium sp. NPDC001681]|uniref:GHMP family kinase ATP-binding protein n=1 Tax=Streptosporangium sp. NPDC001681 TaxID=3154395 RepID=UPI003324A089